MKKKLDEDDYYSDMDDEQFYRDWAADSGFTLDLDAPFESVDAWKFYRDYSIHLNKFANAGANGEFFFGNPGANKRNELWAILYKARKKLQSHEYEELSNRVLLLESKRWLDDLEMKMFEERLRRDGEDGC